MLRSEKKKLYGMTEVRNLGVDHFLGGGGTGRRLPREERENETYLLSECTKTQRWR